MSRTRDLGRQADGRRRTARGPYRSGIAGPRSASTRRTAPADRTARFARRLKHPRRRCPHGPAASFWSDRPIATSTGRYRIVPPPMDLCDGGPTVLCVFRNSRPGPTGPGPVRAGRDHQPAGSNLGRARPRGQEMNNVPPWAGIPSLAPRPPVARESAPRTLRHPAGRLPRQSGAAGV